MGKDSELRKITAIMGHLYGLSAEAKLRILNYVRERAAEESSLADLLAEREKSLNPKSEGRSCAEIRSLPH